MKLIRTEEEPYGHIIGACPYCGCNFACGTHQWGCPNRKEPEPLSEKEIEKVKEVLDGA
jgi:hypothetical protein